METLLEIYKRIDAKTPTQKSFEFIDIYEDLLSHYRGGQVSIVEIGVAAGGSLKLWKEYLGPLASIYGIDVRPFPQYNEPQIVMLEGDQNNRDNLKKVGESIPWMNIIIDDGGHEMHQQINTFEVLFPMLSPGGWYICEDTHTSYRKTHGGEYKKKGTFIEYCKDLTDSLNYREDERIRNDDITSKISYISFFPSMVIIRKAE